jgi:uncharacterized tellurite resistance protein B-like protein
MLGAFFDETRDKTMKRFFQQLLNDLLNSSGEMDGSAKKQHSLEMAASVILLETAATDRDVSNEELAGITDILRQHFNLAGPDTDALLEAAETARREAIDIHQFTQIINEHCSKDQKAKLIEYVWQIIYTDGRLDKHEDFLAHKLARLMHIDHKDFIAAKLKARKFSNASESVNR